MNKGQIDHENYESTGKFKKNQIEYRSGEVRLEQEQQQQQQQQTNKQNERNRNEKRSNPTKFFNVGSSQRNAERKRWKKQEEWGRFFCAEKTEICYGISETECRASAITLDLGIGQSQKKMYTIWLGPKPNSTDCLQNPWIPSFLICSYDIMTL